MKRLLVLPIVLAACAQLEPIEDYNAPYLFGKEPVTATPEVRPTRIACEDKPGTFYKPGHSILCDETETEVETPPVTCTDAGQWIPGRRYANGGKTCA